MEHARPIRGDVSGNFVYADGAGAPDPELPEAPAATSRTRPAAAEADQKSRCIEQIAAERDLYLQLLKQARQMESLGIMTTGLAHDLNNVLTAVLGYAELVEMHPVADPQMLRNVQHISEAARRGVQMIAEIQRFARAEDRDHRESTLQAAVEEALRLLDATKPADVEIRRLFSDDASMVLCGPVHVHQITVNLCRNAMQAMAPGGGTINVSVCQYEHDPEARPELPLLRGKYNCLTIAHSGTAHNPCQYRSAVTTGFCESPGVAPGTLGIALVQAVVGAMGGHVTTRGTAADGAEVSVYFPPQNARSTHGRRPSEPRSAPHILVVDDEPNVVQVLKLMLVRSGYVVSVAFNGATALDMFNSEPESIDMLITDVHMPGLRGDNLARAIRRQRPDIPVLFITGHEEELHLSFMDNRESGHVLQKPFDYAQLLQGIKSAEILHPSAATSGIEGER